MSDFRKLTDDISASPQISVADVEQAAEQGFALIVNNRPEGESPDQPTGAEIEAAAKAAGMAYVAIPIDPATGFGEEKIDAMAAALAETQGPALAFCRSGTRSTLLWSLSQAKAGRDLDEIAETAARAGYDISPIMPMMQALAARSSG